jgi:hypothetical protein
VAKLNDFGTPMEVTLVTGKQFMKPKKPTVAQMHKRLQPVFNHYIRLRDTYVNEVGERVGTCISCGADKPYAELQAGHFVPEQKSYFLRYDESNVNAQCQQCNGFRKGNVWGYMLGLADKIGQYEVFELVMAMSKTRKYTVALLEEAITYYKAKIKEMEE